MYNSNIFIYTFTQSLKRRHHKDNSPTTKSQSLKEVIIKTTLKGENGGGDDGDDGDDGSRNGVGRKNKRGETQQRGHHKNDTLEGRRKEAVTRTTLSAGGRGRKSIRPQSARKRGHHKDNTLGWEA